MERLKCVSLFSGIGGFDLAMTNLGHEIVGACEIDGPARTIYARHFPKVKLWQDATKLDPKDLPGHDILMGGFPCQAFSVAGKRLGFQECRGTLFYEIIRVVKETRPSIVFLENVMGLLNHDNARTIIQIISSLDEVGYDVEWQVTNSKYHVPQNRERIFIVGHLRGSGSRKIFPITDINGQDNVKQQETQTAKKPKLKTVKEDDRDSYRVYDPSGIARTLRASQGGLGKMTGVYAVEKPTMLTERRTEKAKQIRKENRKNGRDYNPRREKELVPRTDGLANCLTTSSGDGYERFLLVNKRLRKLTPTECERLQGFPDSWTEGQSDTQRYKQLGNAVTVPMVQIIAERFKIE